MKTFVVIVVSFFLLSSAYSRDNPFAPVQDYKSLPISKPISSPNFDKEIIPVIQKAKCIAAEPESKTKKELKKVWKAPKHEIKKRVRVQKTIRTPKPRIHKAKRRYHRPHFRLIYKNENLKIYTKTRYIKIFTNDQLINDFILYRPTRLVLDFGDDFVIYNTISKSLRNAYIKKLKIGTHDYFYRLTFILHKKDTYKIKTTSYGYLITLF